MKLSVSVIALCVASASAFSPAKFGVSRGNALCMSDPYQDLVDSSNAFDEDWDDWDDWDDLPVVPVLTEPNFDTNLDTNYSYDRYRVVELTQLICRNLEDLPSNVDRDRIYNCVRYCYSDFKTGWDDNPKHYLLDVRMLLNVCRASAWFSRNQLESFDTMCVGNNW